MSIFVEPILSEEALHEQFTSNSITVLQKRYLRKDENGQAAESIAGMFRRVARHIAQGDDEITREETETLFYNLLTRLRFVPNSPTFTGAGTPLGQLAACFVLPIDDDMGRKPGGIFQSLRDAALIQQTGGGNGFSFSRLRPKNSLVVSSMGKATGPVGFLRVYDRAFGEIAQGGCLTPDTLVFTEDGLLRLEELVAPDIAGWQPHALTVATDEGAQHSPQGFNNGLSPVLRIATDYGLSLTGTPNHKVKVLTSAGPAWRRLDEVQPGEAIQVILNQHSGKIRTLQHPAQHHGNQIMPQLPAQLDEALAFFIGYLMGDGFVAQGDSDHRVGVSVAHSSYLIEALPSLLRQLFGDAITIHTQQKPEDASVTFVIDNRALKDFLLLNGLGKGSSHTVAVPRLIRQSPPEVVGAFLRGLFEADGALSHGYPMLISTSETLICEVATLLMGLGCPVRIAPQSDNNERYGTAPMWQVRVHSCAGLEQWQARIGCDPRSRFQVCHTFEPDLARESSYELPHPIYWLTPVLDAITLPQIDRRGRGQGKHFRSAAPQLRKQLLRYTRGERQLTLSAYRQLSAQHPEFAQHARPVGDHWYVTVTAIEPAGEALTLDLEVEHNHTYLANGMTVHNSRRGANMAVLRIDHPDIEEFISCKTTEGAISNFNISVGMVDAFMEAVEQDAEWPLVFPDTQAASYRSFEGAIEDAREAGLPLLTHKTLPARDLFNRIVKQAWRNGEPGMLFLDAAQRDNPVPHLGRYESTNPCGEQFLLPYENCCLGSINLAKHLTTTTDGTPTVDWGALAETIEVGVHFLDNVVTVNAYVPAVPQLREAALRSRRIGLGIMGLADLLFHVGIAYGSEAGQDMAAQIMEFCRYHAMRSSMKLAQARGPFPAISGSRYDPQAFTWEAPQWPAWLGSAPQHDWGRPALDWAGLVKQLKQHGIRNAAQLTIAPTGTIATISGAEGYGCEPVFALSYTRNMLDEGRQIALRYSSPHFVRALEASGMDAETQERVLEQVALTGSCQSVEEIPTTIRDVFVVASDIAAEGHIRMQAALQVFTDASISKTVNFPPNATPDDIAEAFRLAWRLGCKGLTVYVAGSREQEVLETESVRQQKQGVEAPAPAPPAPKPWEGNAVRPRPKCLNGRTYRVPTPLGTVYVNININGYDQPFEVFLNIAKAGSDTAAVAEAIARLISLILRMPSPMEPRRRLEEVVDQLSGIGGGRPLGFGHNRVLSLPDGVARVLNDYLKETEVAEEKDGDHGAAAAETAKQQLALFPVGDLCPACGQAAMAYTEGCRRCYACGHSEC